MHSQSIRQRRRRVALEKTQSAQVESDSNQESDEGTDDPDQRSNRRNKVARSYTHGARRSRQFKTTDLIPKRVWSVAAVIALLLSAIAGLNLLHLNSPDWVQVIGEEGVAALSLDGGRGIGVWYSNFLLLLTSCVSLQLYLLRRHRRDDYKGSYRIWLWLGFIFLLASAASVTGISTVLRNLTSSLLGSESVGTGLVWIVAIKLVGLTLLIVRGLVEVRFSRLAVVGLLTVLMAYGTATLIHEIPNVQAQSSEYIHASLGNCLLAGCTALFISALGFARFVYLDANGLIKARDNSKRNERREARAEAKAETKSKAKSRRAEESRLKEESKEQAKEEARLKKQRIRDERQQEKESRRTEKAEAKKASREKVKADRHSEDESASESEPRKRRKKKSAKSSEPVVFQEVASDENNRARKKKKKRDSDDTASSDSRSTTSTKSKSKSKSGSRSKRRVEQEAPALDLGQVNRRKKKSSEANQSNQPCQASSANSHGDEYLLSISDEEADDLSKSDRRRLRKLRRRDERRAA